MNAWIHAHPLMAVALAAMGGGSLGILIGGLLAGGRRRVLIVRHDGRDRVLERHLGHTLNVGRMN